MFFRRFAPKTSYSWVVCGLGNPDSKYAATRHNLGFWVADALAEKWNAARRVKKFQGVLREASFSGESVLLVKPMTYMNGSGLCVGPLMRAFRDSNLLVVFDDVSLPLGKLRLKKGGSAGGHKGVQSVIRHHGEDFHRLKLGIGGAELPFLSDWVLESFEPEEMPVAMDMVAKAVLKVEEIVRDGWDAAVTRGFESGNEAGKENENNSANLTGEIGENRNGNHGT